MNLVQQNKIDLGTIAIRTGIPIRTLRYTLDHDIVAGLRIAQSGRGNARQMSLFDALALSLAASMLHEGVSMARVCEIMDQLRGARRSNNRQSLWRLFDQAPAQARTARVQHTRTGMLVTIEVRPWLLLDQLTKEPA